MTDRVEFGEDLKIPFIFVPHGQPESPDVAAFKARYPDWISIPATFVPYGKDRRRENGAPPLPHAGERRHPRYEDASVPPPQIDRRPRGGEPDSSLRAFQRANAVHADPVAALRALRDTPEAFADDAPGTQVAQAIPLPWPFPPPFGGPGSDLDDAARRLSNSITGIFRNESQDDHPPQAQPDAPDSKHASTPTGQRGSPIDVPAGTNRPSTIGGRSYSGHGLDQMQGRGIPPSAVEDAILDGQTSAGRTAGTTVHTGRN